MNKKIIIALACVAGVLLISIVILLFLAKRSAPSLPDTNSVNSPVTNTTTSTVTNNDSTVTPTTTPTPNDSTATPGTTDSKTSLYKTARFFTERYGSYSSDNEHENVESLRPFMTDAMRATADTVVSQQTTTEYYGITTQVANVNIIDYAPAATGATVEVVTQRTESTRGETKRYQQTARLQLKKINEAWQVDTFTWRNL